MSRFRILSRVFALCVVSVGAVACGSAADSRTDSTAAQADHLAIIAAQIDSAPAVVAGAPSAPVTVTEFADFQCPGCRMAATYFVPALRQQYIATGRIRFRFVQFPLEAIHPNAFVAAEAALCAKAAGQFEAYHDRLYAEQPTWAHDSHATARFVQYAVELKIPRAGFQDCLHSHRMADTVRADQRTGRMIGVDRTPTFYVNGQLITGSGREIVDAIEAAEAARAAR